MCIYRCVLSVESAHLACKVQPQKKWSRPLGPIVRRPTSPRSSTLCNICVRAFTGQVVSRTWKNIVFTRSQPAQVLYVHTYYYYTQPLAHIYVYTTCGGGGGRIALHVNFAAGKSSRALDRNGSYFRVARLPFSAIKFMLCLDLESACPQFSLIRRSIRGCSRWNAI